MEICKVSTFKVVTFQPEVLNEPHLAHCKLKQQKCSICAAISSKNSKIKKEVESFELAKFACSKLLPFHQKFSMNHIFHTANQSSKSAAM